MCHHVNEVHAPCATMSMRCTHRATVGAMGLHVFPVYPCHGCAACIALRLGHWPWGMQVENASTAAFVQLVMRLSETLFRPVFLRTFDWALSMPTDGESVPLVLRAEPEGGAEDGEAEEEGACSSQVDVGRSILFYHLMHKMSTELKGLIVPYFGHLIDPCVLLLEALTPALADGGHRTKRARITEEPDREQGHASHAVLLQYIVDSLHSCALYDTGTLLDAERFPKLVEPMCAQLENMLGGEEAYKVRTEEHVAPCLVQMAITVHDDQMWKPLHHAILRRTRSDVAMVRKAALSVVHQLFNRLGESYMVMLPETVPYLAELMEDDNSEVEALCQRVIKDIEVLSGESLQAYFN